MDENDEPLFRPETFIPELVKWICAAVGIGILAAVAASGVWPW